MCNWGYAVNGGEVALRRPAGIAPPNLSYRIFGKDPVCISGERPHGDRIGYVVLVAAPVQVLGCIVSPVPITVANQWRIRTAPGHECSQLACGCTALYIRATDAVS